MVSHKYYLLRKYTQYSPEIYTSDMSVWLKRINIDNCFRRRIIESINYRSPQTARRVEEDGRTSSILLMYEIIEVVEEEEE